MNHTEEVDEFNDIRPYNDREVPAVLSRLMDDPELADTLLSMKYPRMAKFLAWAMRPMIRRALHRAFDDIGSVADLQMLIGKHMEKMLADSSTPFTVSGIEKLEKGQAYLFVSNHRDIAMDPAFVNLALHQNGLETVRIAIGDNLLTKAWASDLMRVNKSFIVKRSVSGRKEKFTALTTLSKYIRQSLLKDGSHVWIAQREGRAKDGLDRTDTAVIKMISLGKERGQTFAEAMDPLKLVPVSISYMYDPCDLDKALELHQRRLTGEFHKSEDEVLLSIYKGVVGYKGAVHLAIGDVVSGCEDDEVMAAEIDRQIIGNYCLQPTNLIAWEKLNGVDTRISQLKARLDCDWRALEDEFISRVDHQQEAVRQIFLAMYANPVQSRLDMVETGGASLG